MRAIFWLGPAVLVGGWLVSCGRGERQPYSEVKTNLGAAGNQEVLERYQAYLAKGRGCRAEGNGKRVILSGFGLFRGVSYNISGAVVASMADAAFWPAEWSVQSPKDDLEPKAFAAPSSGNLADRLTNLVLA